MNTTISPNGLPALPQAKTNQGSNGSQAGSTVAGGSSAAQADDSVKLTDSGKALSEASSAGDSIDTKRVESIRTSLANGTYQINPSNIADKLTSMESQIGGNAP